MFCLCYIVMIFLQNSHLYDNKIGNINLYLSWYLLIYSDFVLRNFWNFFEVVNTISYREFKIYCVLYLPPSLSSAIACALFFLLVIRHWYEPLSSRPTFSTANETGVNSLILQNRQQKRWTFLENKYLSYSYEQAWVNIVLWNASVEYGSCLL